MNILYSAVFLKLVVLRIVFTSGSVWVVYFGASYMSLFLSHTIKVVNQLIYDK